MFLKHFLELRNLQVLDFDLIMQSVDYLFLLLHCDLDFFLDHFQVSLVLCFQRFNFKLVGMLFFHLTLLYYSQLFKFLVQLVLEIFLHFLDLSVLIFLQMVELGLESLFLGR